MKKKKVYGTMNGKQILNKRLADHINDLLDDAEQINVEITNMRYLYERLNDIFKQLIDLGFRFNDELRLQDNFQGKYTVYKTTCINRYELVSNTKDTL